MARVYFQRSSAGQAMVQGQLVEEVQRRLLDGGFLPGGAQEVDGRFGKNTEQALRGFQTARGLPESGAVDGETWKGLTGQDAPELFARCLQLTAMFEGTGFRKVVGNFDGAGITWGIIGFTLVHGEIGELLQAIDASRPGLVDQCFGAGPAAELRQVLAKPVAERLAWGQSVSQGQSRLKVAAPWSEGFEALGADQDVQRLQLDRARNKYWALAQKQVQALGLTTELGHALLFDIAVQNGGLDAAERQEISYQLGHTPAAGEPEKLQVIAQVVAQGSSPRWRENVLRRKMTICQGSGTVNGEQFTVANWGLGNSPA